MNEQERADKIETLRRYEDARREHLGSAINLTFGLAAAAVGFCIKLITDQKTYFRAPGTYYFLAATGAFILTVVLCMFTTWTRLRDFRVTAQKIRKEIRGATDAELDDLQAAARRYSRCTWGLFRIQLFVFAIGIFLLGYALWTLYYDCLFPK